MQAGPVDGKLSFRGVLTALAAISRFAALLMRARWQRQALIPRLAAAWQPLLAGAPYTPQAPCLGRL